MIPEEAEIEQAKETCMCGEPMEDHSAHCGHTPLSMYDYYLREKNTDGETDDQTA